MWAPSTDSGHSSRPTGRAEFKNHRVLHAIPARPITSTSAMPQTHLPATPSIAASSNRTGIPAQAPTLQPQHVLITGGTGFIGQALVQQLLDGGHRVTLVSRNPTKAQARWAGKVGAVPTPQALPLNDAVDAVVNLAGAPVVGPRWSAARQKVLLDSRVGTSLALVQWLRTTPHRPAVWVQASAIGFYGVRPPDEVLTEDSVRGRGFMSDLCVRWEAAAAEATALGVRQVVLRLGVVLGPGGALPPLLLPVRLGLGGRMGSGQQIMSWIHRDDVLALVAAALRDTDMHGVYNATAPQPVPQATFAATAGQLLHRPIWFPTPAAPMRWLLGEMAELFVDGQRVMPARLLREGFVFRHPALLGALQDLV